MLTNHSSGQTIKRNERLMRKHIHDKAEESMGCLVSVPPKRMSQPGALRSGNRERRAHGASKKVSFNAVLKVMQINEDHSYVVALLFLKG